MKKTVHINSVMKTTIVMTLTLGLATSNLVSFSDTLSRLDYAKEIMNEKGISTLQVPNGLEDITEEDYVYTALQNGLFRGVSFKFHEPITEDECAIMQTNAMDIEYVENSTNSTMKSDANTDDATQNEESESIDFMTEYGEVKRPSNLNPNENIWTDEEFADLIENDMDGMYDTIPYNVKWKFDYDKKQFSLGLIKYDENGNRIYLPVDEMTNGRLFNMAKAVVYHAKLNGLESTLYDYGNGRCSFTISHPERGSENIVIFLTYAPRERDGIYESVPDYEVGTTNLLHEWELNKLFDEVVFDEMGYNSAIIDEENADRIRQEYHYAEQHYADFVYGVCNQLYGNDGLQMYKAMMGEYLNDHIQTSIYNIDEDTSKHIETDKHNIYKYSPYMGWTYYGVNKK